MHNPCQSDCFRPYLEWHTLDGQGSFRIIDLAASVPFCEGESISRDHSRLAIQSGMVFDRDVRIHTTRPGSSTVIWSIGLRIDLTAHFRLYFRFVRTYPSRKVAAFNLEPSRGLLGAFWDESRIPFARSGLPVCPSAKLGTVDATHRIGPSFRFRAGRAESSRFA
jgi:hypothetical protein